MSIGIPKIEMIRLSCGFVLSCVQKKSHWTEEFHIRDVKSVSHPSSPLGHQLFGLQLHLCSPFEGHVHQELEAAEVLCEVWRGRGRGVEEPAAGAEIALHAGAAEDGGGEWPFLPASEHCLGLHGLQQLSRPVAVHSWHRRVGGCRAGLHGCGDSGVTDDRGPVWNEARRGRRGDWGGHRVRHGLPQDAGNAGIEAGGVEDALVACLLCACSRTAVFRGLGAVGEAVTDLAAFSGDGELVGVFAVFP